MKFHKLPIIASLISMALPANAESFLLLHDTYDLHPPYSQDWYATTEDYLVADSGGHDVLIRGDGKHGSFFGLLRVNCEEPHYSRWLFEEGMIDSNRVPRRAISKLRRTLC